MHLRASTVGSSLFFVLVTQMQNSSLAEFLNGLLFRGGLYILVQGLKLEALYLHSERGPYLFFLLFCLLCSARLDPRQPPPPASIPRRPPPVESPAVPPRHYLRGHRHLYPRPPRAARMQDQEVRRTCGRCAWIRQQRAQLMQASVHDHRCRLLRLDPHPRAEARSD